MAAQKFSFRITQGGWAFMALTILLCLGAFNAALNTVYLLASLLAAMALVSVAVPIWNLRGLSCRRALRDDDT